MADYCIWRLQQRRAAADDRRLARRGGRSEERGGSLTRRELLGVGAVAGLTGLAGCSQVCPQEFEAPLAVLPKPGRFGLADSQPQRLEVEQRVAVVDDRLLVNYYTVYAAASAGASAPVGVLSTPTVTCFGQTLNPLATQEFAELLETPQVRARFVGLVASQATTTAWQQGPTPHETWSGELLGQTVPIEAFTGVVGAPEEPSYAVVIALARHTVDGETVLVGAGTAQQLSPEATPATVTVVPATITRTAVAGVGQLFRDVVPEIEKRAAARPTDGYGAGGYEAGGYGDVTT